MKGHDDVMDRWKAPRHAKIGDLTALARIGSINTQKSRENDARRVAVRALAFSYLRFLNRPRRCI